MKSITIEKAIAKIEARIAELEAITVKLHAAIRLSNDKIGDYVFSGSQKLLDDERNILVSLERELRETDNAQRYAKQQLEAKKADLKQAVLDETNALIKVSVADFQERLARIGQGSESLLTLLDEITDLAGQINGLSRDKPIMIRQLRVRCMAQICAKTGLTSHDVEEIADTLRKTRNNPSDVAVIYNDLKATARATA